MAEHTVRSPLPGTFYRRPSPDADPFVKEGDAVSQGDVICLVEVMKSFHEVKADQAGVVDRFLIEDSEPIEAGQDIVTLRDSGP
jgi:biotin carboxyl carrier protein